MRQSTKPLSVIAKPAPELPDLGSVIAPTPAEISEYLAQYPDMRDVLVEVSRLTEQEFGEEAKLYLEVWRDPEADDKYLTLYVRQSAYDKHIMDRIEKVRMVYEDIIFGKLGWLLVTTDFRRLRSE